MSTTFSLLRSRSNSPENSDDERPKPSNRYLRRDIYEPDRLRYFRRISRARCILLSVALLAFLACFLSKGPIGPPYLTPKCHVAILLEGIPPTPSKHALQSDWASREDVPSPDEMASWAKVVHPDELFESLERGVTPSPKLIHQSWKNKQLPAKFQKWSREWQRLQGADWRYVLWTDEDNLNLVKRYYPAYLETYQALKAEIYRADMVRNMYLHRFGGIYADLDLIPLAPLQQHLPVLNSTAPSPMRIAYVGRMGDPKYKHSIPNAFMVSTSAGHPFWMRPLTFVKHNISVRTYNREPENLTGPVALKICVDEWQQEDEREIRNGAGEYDEVRIIENAKIYPFTWNDSSLGVQCVCDPRNPTVDWPRCRQIYPDAWTMTYWTHSWE